MPLVMALCALHVWMAASVSRTFSTTFDEIAHLTAGYAYWTTGDYRFQPENGNLPQRLAALPLLTQGVKFPPADGYNWKMANVWLIGSDFFYKNGNNLPAMLAAGRTMNALLSGILCFLIFIWSRALFEQRAALLSLMLAVFSPALLANGGLITSDTAAALGFTVASLAWWRLLQHVTIGRLLAAGLGAGLLAISKHSVVLFAPMALLVLGVRLMRTKPLVVSFSKHHFRLAGWKRLPALAGVSAIALGLCITVIWGTYGFRYQASPPDAQAGASFVQSWDEVLLKNHPPPPSHAAPDTINLQPGPVQYFVAWSRAHRILPEAWLYGLSFVEINARGRMAFFAGEYRLTGWRSFFPTLFLLKTTIPALTLMALGLAGLASVPANRRHIWLYRVSPLIVLLVVYWTFSIQSKLNIGHRHLLPTYAALFILAGGSTLLLRWHKAWCLPLVLLLVWHGRESLAIRPDYLAHFNPLGGGPKQAYHLFVDSSLDWGQDLPRLHTWLEKHTTGERIYLSYFGTGDPKHEGIDAIRIGDPFYPELNVSVLKGGVYCLSATMFSRVYSPIRGPWSEKDEIAYQLFSTWLRHLRSLPAEAPPTWMDGTALDTNETSARLANYDSLRFGRLCHFLQSRPPNDRIGYSILIFRLSEEDVSLAMNAPLPLLNKRILKAMN
jgi:hypothetical protein